MNAVLLDKQEYMVGSQDIFFFRFKFEKSEIEITLETYEGIQIAGKKPDVDKLVNLVQMAS